MNFEQKKIKTTYKEATENSDALSKKIELGIEKKINYDAVETSSKNLKVSRKSSTRPTSDSTRRAFAIHDSLIALHSWLTRTCLKSFRPLQSELPSPTGTLNGFTVINDFIFIPFSTVLCFSFSATDSSNWLPASLLAYTLHTKQLSYRIVIRQIRILE